MEENSKWKIYGYGNVAIDKPEGTTIIEVFLKDRLFAAEGDLSESNTMLLTASNSEGIIKTENIESRKTIPARWLAESQPNRITSPDVRKNETVLIYRYANNDDYYWEKIFSEGKLRGKETVTYAFKNTDDKVEITIDNSYILHFSTKDKLIQIHTAINDGEAVGYDFIIDTKESTYSMQDTRGNIHQLNSSDDEWTLKANKKINLDANEINLTATSNINIKAGAIFSVQSAGGSFTGANGKYTASAMLSCTDLSTNNLSSINNHYHHTPNGDSSTPISSSL